MFFLSAVASNMYSLFYCNLAINIDVPIFYIERIFDGLRSLPTLENSLKDYIWLAINVIYTPTINCL